MNIFDLVTIGHFSIDHIFSPRLETPTQMLGGSAAYVSFAARKLGACVGVVSKVGNDFPEVYTKLLRSNGVDLFGVKKVRNFSTTSFIIKYLDGKRRLLLKTCAPCFLTEDVKLLFKAKVIHVAPIAGEISSEIVDELREKTNTLSLDPQGFLRKFAADGKVTLRKWKDKQVLGQIDVYKSSLQEIKVVTGLRRLKDSMKEIRNLGPKIVIVTLGRKGAAIFFEETFHRIPNIQSKAFADPTGAGDVFAGAFLAENINRKDAVWCACVGSAMASFKVETIGPLFSGEKETIYRRAERLYKKCMQMETHNWL